MNQLSNLKIAFFGTPEIAKIVLEELQQSKVIPSLVVCNPDALVGRKQVLTPPPVKVWAATHSIPVLQSTNLKDKTILTPLTDQTWDLFIVAAYGNLIPEWLLELPKYGVLNVHPSLLPKLRGASPIRSAILSDIRETGVTIMKLDKELDHGPVVAQLPIDIEESHWPMRGAELDSALAHMGGALLASIIPQWINGEITPIEQNHSEATFCGKITKDMSQLTIDPYNLPKAEEAYQALLKIRAFDVWPETYFMHNGKRVKIRDAELASDGSLLIKKVVPEGKNEMEWNQYLK